MTSASASHAREAKKRRARQVTPAVRQVVRDRRAQQLAVLGPQMPARLFELRSRRAELEADLEAAVRLSREVGLSWDVIGSHLGVPGETLRRRYS